MARSVQSATRSSALPQEQHDRGQGPDQKTDRAQVGQDAATRCCLGDGLNAVDYRMVLRLRPRTRQLGLHLQTKPATFSKPIASVLRHRSDGTALRGSAVTKRPGTAPPSARYQRRRAAACDA